MALPRTCQNVRFWLGYYAYWRGKYEPALTLLKPLAEGGHAAAQFYLGRMFARAEGVDRDLANAIRWWNASAGAGEPWSQVAIGSLYERGIAVPRDRSKALKWYLKAAHNGLPEAQARVGFFYESGAVGDRDQHKARHWYLLADNATRLKRRNKISLLLKGNRRTLMKHWSKPPYQRRGLV